MPQDPDATLIHQGGAVLDLARGTLTREGQVVPLRSKSFRLLCELARQPGRVVPKDELLDAVWPDVIVTEASSAKPSGTCARPCKTAPGSSCAPCRGRGSCSARASLL